METIQKPISQNEEVQGEKHNGIKVEKISDVKEHVGEIFLSEKINVSEEKVKQFVALLGDINPIHFDKSRVNESVNGEMAKGRIYVPGLLTHNLWCNKDVFYQALQIEEGCEFMLKSTGKTKFGAPVFADSDLIFKLTLKSATDCIVESRKGISTNWDVVAYTQIGEKMRKAMVTDFTLLSISLV